METALIPAQSDAAEIISLNHWLIMKRVYFFVTIDFLTLITY